MLFLWMDDYNDGVTREIELGKNVRGVQLNGERPLNCHIAPEEFNNVYRLHKPEEYFITLQHALKPGGRIVIR